MSNGDRCFLKTMGSLNHTKCLIMIWPVYESTRHPNNLCLHCRIIHKNNLCLHDTQRKNAMGNINVLQQTACLLVNPITGATLLSSLIARRWVGLQTI